MAATDEQYGNRGYGQIGSHTPDPYNQRGNLAQGRYDDRMAVSSLPGHPAQHH